MRIVKKAIQAEIGCFDCLYFSVYVCVNGAPICQWVNWRTALQCHSMGRDVPTLCVQQTNMCVRVWVPVYTVHAFANETIRFLLNAVMQIIVPKVSLSSKGYFNLVKEFVKF